jgi:hypothetical protein
VRENGCEIQPGHRDGKKEGRNQPVDSGIKSSVNTFTQSRKLLIIILDTILPTFSVQLRQKSINLFCHIHKI